MTVAVIRSNLKLHFGINSGVIDVSDLCVTGATMTQLYPFSCCSVDTVSWVNDVCTFGWDYISVIQFGVCVAIKPTL